MLENDFGTKGETVTLYLAPYVAEDPAIAIEDMMSCEATFIRAEMAVPMASIVDPNITLDNQLSTYHVGLHWKVVFEIEEAQGDADVLLDKCANDESVRLWMRWENETGGQMLMKHVRVVYRPMMGMNRRWEFVGDWVYLGI